MKQPKPSITGLLLVFLAAFPAVAQERSLPDLIYSLDENRTQPVWVSTDAGLIDGKLEESLFSDTELSELENLVSLARQQNREEGRVVAPGTCSIVTRPSGGAPPPSFHEAARDNSYVFTGHIEAAEEGFYHGLPRKLFRISVDQVRKAPVGTVAPTELYAIYPQAQLLIEGELICERSYRRYSQPPVVGKRVVIFGSRLDQTELLLLTVGIDGWIVEAAEGEVFLPGQNADTTLDPVDWSWVEDLLSSLLEEQRGEQ